jgi:hypothetical protein
VLERCYRVYFQKMRLRVVLLLAFALLTFVLQTAVLRMHRNVSHGTPARRSFAAWSLPCLVLTLNVSNVDPSTRSCTPFVAPSFTETELNQVSPLALKKILNPMLLESASDLTNNASVNIYMNHVRIWQFIARRWDVALVLEEDIIVPPHADKLIAQVLSALRLDNVTNYVVKLMDLSIDSNKQWTLTHLLSQDIIGNHELRTCMCQTSTYSSCSSAYLLDRTAALTLLDNAFPASKHVDVFMHLMGCVDKKLRLYQLFPHPMRINNRPSTHLTYNFQRRYLLFKEKIFTFLNSNC